MKQKTKYRIKKLTRIGKGTMIWYVPQKQIKFLCFKFWITLGDCMYISKYKAYEQIKIDSGIKNDKDEVIKEFEL